MTPSVGTYSQGEAMEEDALLKSIVNEMFEVLWTFGKVAERYRAGSASGCDRPPSWA
jgi:hypothetical protein